MDKDVKRNFLILLSCLFIIIFSFLFLGKSSKKVVRQNIIPSDLSGNINPVEKTGVWHGQTVSIPSDNYETPINQVLSVVPRDDRWIEVSLSAQKLTAWENGKIFLETPVSTGLPYFPTPQGEFYIWIKLRYANMEGGEGKYYYNLPNVPYVMYFANEKIPSYRGYGLHGTYWHNDFGHVHSHGCVNLPTPIAKELFYWTYPMLNGNQNSVRATANNPGTKVVIHE